MSESDVYRRQILTYKDGLALKGLITGRSTAKMSPKPTKTTVCDGASVKALVNSYFCFWFSYSTVGSMSVIGAVLSGCRFVPSLVHSGLILYSNNYSTWDIFLRKIIQYGIFFLYIEIFFVI